MNHNDMQGRDCHKCVETQTFSLFQIDCCASFAGKPRLLQQLSDGFSRFNLGCVIVTVSFTLVVWHFVITWHCGIFRQSTGLIDSSDCILAGVDRLFS